MKKIKKSIIALILALILSSTIIITNGIKTKAATPYFTFSIYGFGLNTNVYLYMYDSNYGQIIRYDNNNYGMASTNDIFTINIVNQSTYNLFVNGTNYFLLATNMVGAANINRPQDFPNDYNTYHIISINPSSVFNVNNNFNFTNSFTFNSSYDGSTIRLNFNNLPQQYTITFNANGGTGTPPASVEVEPGSHYTIPGNTTGLTREGYTFQGWNTSSTATTGATSLSNIISDITLYAIWQIQQFTITFNANGGTGTPPSQTLVNYGANYTIPGNTTGLTREGYTFQGWNTFSDATGGITTLSNITSNRTLYAIWAPDTYTITFNANGGTGTPPSQTLVNYGANYTIPGNTTGLTREGYTFQGWNTSSTAQTGLTQIIIENNTTLYAIWRINRSDLLKIYLNDNLIGQYSIITTGTSAHYMIAFDGFDIALFELYLNGGELSPQYQSNSYILSSNMNNIVFTLSGENIYTLLIYNNDTLEEDWTYDDLVENGTAYIHFYNGGDIEIKIYTRQGINTDTESLINTFKMLFKGANEILNIRFGWITIGGILAIVLSIGVIFFIFKLIRGGL